MPQFDIYTYSSLVFWTLMSFSLCYLLVQGLIIPSMDKLLTQRWEQTDGHREKTEDLLSEADLINQTYEKAIIYAREDARRLLQKTRDTLVTRITREKTQILYQINFKFEAEKRRIEEERIRLLKEVDTVSERLLPIIFQKISLSTHPFLREKPWTSI